MNLSELLAGDAEVDGEVIALEIFANPGGGSYQRLFRVGDGFGEPGSVPLR